MEVSFAILLVVSAFASAQHIPDNLPKCVSRCVRGVEVNMISMYGCKKGDFKCYCSNPNFNFGIVDCSQDYCLGSKQAIAVVSYAASFCSSVLRPTHAATSGGDVGRSGSTTVTGISNGKHFTTVVPAPGGTVTALKTVTIHAPNRPPITVAISGSSTRTLGKAPPNPTVTTSTKVVSTTKSSTTTNTKSTTATNTKSTTTTNTKSTTATNTKSTTTTNTNSTTSTGTNVITTTNTKSTSTTNTKATTTTSTKGSSTTPGANAGSGGHDKSSGTGANGAAEAFVTFPLGPVAAVFGALVLA